MPRCAPIGDGKTVQNRVRILSGVKIKSSMRLRITTLTVDYAILRAVFAFDSNRLAPKIQIAIALACVRTVSHNNYPSIHNPVDCFLNSGKVIRNKGQHPPHHMQRHRHALRIVFRIWVRDRQLAIINATSQTRYINTHSDTIRFAR
jgi:hypothetical protein